jgi:hypothetical protein
LEAFYLDVESVTLRSGLAFSVIWLIFPESHILSKFTGSASITSRTWSKPRFAGDTLQGHDWLALDGERIVIPATPAIVFLARAADEKTIAGGSKLIGRGSFIRVSRLIALSGCVCLQMAALAQTTATPPTPDADAKVAAILDRILRRGEGHAEGREDVKTSTWVPPGFDDIEQIREIGHDAIAPLNKALDSQTPFRQLLAVRLLGEIGGTDVVPPLKRGLEANRWVVVRMSSLSSLRSVPDALALPIIRSAVLDSDPRVAERARTLLTDYYQLDGTK